jgi:hypothetical protein
LDQSNLFGLAPWIFGPSLYSWTGIWTWTPRPLFTGLGQPLDAWSASIAIE